jgi:hypothetical protein
MRENKNCLSTITAGESSIPSYILPSSNRAIFLPALMIVVSIRPTRWDEWLHFDSIRLAPFRTRTVNSTGHQSSPAPNHAVVHAPLTGPDDVRVLIPELARLVMMLQPALAEAAALCGGVSRECMELEYFRVES